LASGPRSNAGRIQPNHPANLRDCPLLAGSAYGISSFLWLQDETGYSARDDLCLYFVTKRGEPAGMP